MLVILKLLCRKALNYVARIFSSGVVTPDASDTQTVQQLMIVNNKEDSLDQEQRNRDERNKFIDSVCHEIRNPLTVIAGSADLLREKLSQFKELVENGHLSQDKGVILLELDELVSNIIDSAEFQKNILNRVVTISKIENDPNRLEISSFNPKDLIQNINKLFRPQINQKKLFFKFELPENNIEITSDSTRLKEILINLISNAIKCTASGGITLKLSYPAIENSGQLTILNFTIADTGIGMNDQEVKLLFNRYTQSLSFGSNQTDFGLGLAICKQMITSLGGKIWVETQKGEGSQFHFTICAPAKTLPQMKFSPRMLQPLPVRQNQKQKFSLSLSLSNFPFNILVVDDNAMVRKILVMSLNQENHVCETAANGSEAVNAFNHKKFDIIFMDIKMPIMDGIEATKKIREIEAEKNLKPIVIIGISADARKVHQINAIKSGMNGYLTKPYRKDELLEITQQVAADKKSVSLNSENFSSSFWTNSTKKTTETCASPTRKRTHTL